ncbi:nickel pincer cofactor biosynthesis protein LarC [Desulfopila sp. IMCC35008]|uniref:nickel pincer cofactor biosynthesis protein LarC n=1 Tax=Desulfopila sp. IMCC35008 TaxID=2653858 RepID=UPI0013CFE9B5|nr:nickel pincer cofactor biosynthesis protein LarC [Desulfopila sp. IMCC35008]
MSPTATVGYLDCFSGVSGDMLLGALVHAGLEEDFLRAEIAKLGIADLHMEIEEAKSQSIGCRKVRFSGGNQQPLRTLPVILPILEESGLEPTIVHSCIQVFQALAEAEAKVHEMSPDRVHFHEIGALDTIADIVGVVSGLHHLGISRLACSPLPLGRGFVQCDHGKLPLPAPAVCELLRDIPTYGVDIPLELVTPTGAALIKVLADDFGPMIPMTIHATGYGGGSHTLPDKQPNLLRFFVGSEETVTESQSVTVIETRLDDWNTEGFPHICQRLLEHGALDVSLCPCHGKKGRPGYTLQIICPEHARVALQDLVFQETSAIGLRYRNEKRRTLPRKQVIIETEWGPVTAKQVSAPGGDILYPEYEECKKIADQQNIPLDKVYRIIYGMGEKL